MKQGEAARAVLDLDDLEKQLASVAVPRRPGSEDPLAELARIVGQGDRQAAGAPGSYERRASSFEDFLRTPPRPANGAMPDHTPPIEPLFRQTPSHDGQPALRHADDPLAEALDEAPSLRPAISMDAEEPPPQGTRPLMRPSGEAWRSLAGPHPLSAPAPDASAAPSDSSASAAPARVDDMLAEFEAAMRDVGAQKAPAPSSAPIAAPPLAAAVSRELAFDPDQDGADSAYADASVPASRGSKRGLVLAGGVIGVALVGVVSLMALGSGGRTTSAGQAPVIAAKPGATKERPVNPGGVEVPNQDKEVLQTRPSGGQQAERVAPREEQPVDLAQAQRSAEAQASPTPPAAVRQIPGVLIVGPSSTTPPPGSPFGQPAQPAPRPVASVPITIAGQPPAAPMQIAPANPASVAPSQPAPAVPPPPVMTAPTAPAVAALGASAAPAVAPQAIAPAAQPAEPRRVRAVPIRPDESAPNRAQTQPRVVPPTQRPSAPALSAEAADPNGPLQITPQANRVPQQRAAAVAPGMVPTSTASAPATTQSTSSPAPGGSFAVQLAAEGSEDAAQTKFNRMRSQYGGVLGSVSPSIRSAEVNGRSVYRVRVGSMSREEAVSLCERLKAAGGSCFVARN